MLLEKIQENLWFHYRFQITKLTTLLFLLVCFFLNLPFSEFFRHFLLSLTFSFSCLLFSTDDFVSQFSKKNISQKRGVSHLPSTKHTDMPSSGPLSSTFSLDHNRGAASSLRLVPSPLLHFFNLLASGELYTGNYVLSLSFQTQRFSCN